MTSELRDQLLARLGKVKDSIQQLKVNCCTAGRYCIFDDLISYVGYVEDEFGKGVPHPIIYESQRKMIRAGEVLGKLAVSCCDSRRLANYSECIAELNEILFKSFNLSDQTRGHSYFPDTTT